MDPAPLVTKYVVLQYDKRTGKTKTQELWRVSKDDLQPTKCTAHCAVLHQNNGAYMIRVQHVCAQCNPLQLQRPFVNCDMQRLLYCTYISGT